MSAKYLIYCLFIIPVFGFVNEYPVGTISDNDPCEKVKISIDIKESGSNKYMVNVTVVGAKEPIRYFFSDEKDLLNTNYIQSSMEFLRKGKYTCLVRDAGGCRKLTEFEVK